MFGIIFEAANWYFFNGDSSKSTIMATDVEGRSLVWANMTQILSAEQSSKDFSPLLCDSHASPQIAWYHTTTFHIGFISCYEISCVSSDGLILFNFFSHWLQSLLCGVVELLFTVFAFITKGIMCLLRFHMLHNFFSHCLHL